MSEGSRHLFVKEQICRALALHPDVQDLEQEHDFTLVRADISFRLHGKSVAIEIQRSDVGWTNITERTKHYHTLGIHVLWVLCDESPLQKGLDELVPMWQRCLHALYYGVIYYWVGGQTLKPIHLEPISNPSRQFFNFQQWRWSGPSYAYRRAPWPFDLVQITDLQLIIRASGTYGPYTLPAAHLLNLPYATLEEGRTWARRWVKTRFG